MAKLINGDGNKAIWAAQDADLIAALAGDVTGIAKVGNKYAATQEDANTIGLADGVIVTKEGRRIQLDTGNVDLFDIPTGTAGITNYYIIGYHLFTNSDSSQECETFVRKMDNGTDEIVENTFKGGATEVYVSLYRITQVGLNISSIDALLSELDNISALMSDLDNVTQPYIASVTAGASETWGSLLNKLYEQIDLSKVKNMSSVVLKATNGSIANYSVGVIASTGHIYGDYSRITSGAKFNIYNIDMYTNASTASYTYCVGNAANSLTSMTSDSIAQGSTLTFISI